MVNDHDPAGVLHQTRLHRHGCLVGIHHDQQRMLSHDLQCLLRGDEAPVQLIVPFNLLHHPGDGRIRPLHHNAGFYIVHLRRLKQTDRSPNGIYIRRAVAHNQHLVALLHKVAQRMGNDPRPDSRPLLRRITLAAIEGQALACLYCGLVSAAPQRHVQTGLGQRPQLAG
ncbi:hypothetical protein D3C73_1103720 [compost metagenome]